jgi:hypothetical protein
MTADLKRRFCACCCDEIEHMRLEDTDPRNFCEPCQKNCIKRHPEGIKFWKAYKRDDPVSDCPLKESRP